MGVHGEGEHFEKVHIENVCPHQWSLAVLEELDRYVAFHPG